MINQGTKKLTLLITLFLTVSCVSIPPEAPELSVELGKRISAIESSNITLLHRFFDEKRKAVDKFIDDEWVPTFATNFFSNPNISSAWNTIVSENNKSERLKFIVKVGTSIQEMINKKRLELIKPLDDLEKKIEESIEQEYSQAQAINNSISSFLLSASEVAENRNRFLDMAGMSQTKMNQLIDKTDDAVSSLLSRAQDVQGKIDSAEEYLDKLKKIKNSF